MRNRLMLVAFGCAAAALCAQEVSLEKLVATSFGDANPSAPYVAIQQPKIPGLPRDHFARAYLGDGLLGIRPNPNPLSQSETVAAGFVFSNSSGGFEMAAPAPYPLGTDIRLGESDLLGDSKNLVVHSQTLDLSTAELISEMTFTAASGVRLDLKVTQFVVRTTPALLCQQIEIDPSEDSEIEIVPEIQRDGIPGTVYRNQPPGPRTQVAQVLGFESDRGSKIGEAVLIPPVSGLIRNPDGSYSLKLKKGEKGIFRTIAAVVTSAYNPEPDLEAVRIASWGQMLGFDELRAENAQAWRELWKSRVVVDGDDEAQHALDAAFFYLHSSAHPALTTGVPPFGMSQWSDYAGHIFWDMDSWDLPAVLPADPAAARAMVLFRAQGLKAAMNKAAGFGFEGAMFPWEAGLDGSEVTPSWAETGWAEQHIVPDVAVGAWEYYEATGDEETLKEAVWPIEREVARWISSRGKFTAKGFEIEHVMGHNEWVANASDDSMVNTLCKMALHDAIAAARAVSVEPPSLWSREEAAMYLPIDSARQVIAPFSLDIPPLYYNESLDRYEQVNIREHPEAYTLNNLQILVFHDSPIPEALFRNTWAYEETLRSKRAPSPSVPGSVRSPGFSIPPLAACAAMFGDRQEAADLFHLAAHEYVTGPFLISKEYRPYTDGDYVTNQASLLLAAIYGFTGLRISSGDWRKHPVSLPMGWKSIEIQQLWIRGRAYRLTAEQGKPLLLTAEAAPDKKSAAQDAHAPAKH
jgi:protein-glucosylgalactosylhydroxylysine glucosidase